MTQYQSRLLNALCEFAQTRGQGIHGHDSMSLAFFAGAAAMAELALTGQESMLNELRKVAQTLQDSKPTTDERCLIWSFEHQGWWGRRERGYYPDIDQAGTYSVERGIQICRKANITKINEALAIRTAPV